MESDFAPLDRGDHESCIICDECDLLVDVGCLAPGQKASCPRCGLVLSRAYANAVDRILVFSATAAILLLLSNLFGMVQMTVQGQEREITLLETVRELFKLEELALSGFMLVVVIGLPLVFVGLTGWLALAIRLRRASALTIGVLRMVGYLRFWNMAEIFFLGILISMVKIASMADIAVGFSFWTYGMFNVFMIAAMMHVDKFQLAQAIKRIDRERQGESVHTACA